MHSCFESTSSVPVIVGEPGLDTGFHVVHAVHATAWIPNSASVTGLGQALLAENITQQSSSISKEYLYVKNYYVEQSPKKHHRKHIRVSIRKVGMERGQAGLRKNEASLSLFHVPPPPCKVYKI